MPVSVSGELSISWKDTVTIIEALKKVKHWLTEIQRIKIDEQKKAVRAGYDMDILPADKISPVPIEFGPIEGESKGFYSLSEKYIKVKEGMSDTQTLKTMVHEISHAMLHDPDRIKDNLDGCETFEKYEEAILKSLLGSSVFYISDQK